MKRALVLVVVIVGSVAVWRLGSRLSADAVGMAIGIVLGVLAGIPAALLILAGSRRREERIAEQWHDQPREHMMAPAYQPPVIVLAGPAPPLASPPQLAAPAHSPPQAIHGWTQLATARQFKIVGEQEHWLE